MSDENERSVASTGSVAGEPVAWAVVSDSTEEIDCEFVYPDEATAGDVALDSNGGVVPLYRHPPRQDFSQKNLTLTDAERETIEWAVRAMRPECRAVLQGLLERTK